MRRSTGCILFLLLIQGYCFSQTITGKIFNSSGQPIGNCNVFISNTTRGTTSNNDGVFIITNVPAGKHELVVSSVVYETYVLPFSGDQLPLSIEVVLKLKIKELENVTVEPFEEGGW